MKTKLLGIAVLLLSMAIAPDAFGANMWRTNGGHGGGSGSSGSFVSGSGGSGSGGSDLEVPEPSSLYAIGSGLALLGVTGWVLRRKK